MNVCNPLAEEIKSPGLVWEAGGGAAVGLPGWGQHGPAGSEDGTSVCSSLLLLGLGKALS